MASSKRKPCVIVVGSCNMDIVSYVDRVPEAGETLQAKAFHTGIGGKGLNQAAACARLSRKKSSPEASEIDVRIIGTVGKLDPYGASLLDSMTANGINKAGVQLSSRHNTGTAIILVETSTGQNRIVFNANANAATSAESAIAALQQVGVLIDLIIMQLEIPLDTVMAVLEYAQEHAIPTLLNPAPMLEIPERTFAMITHLVLNETEAASLVNEPLAALDEVDVVAKVTTQLRKKGAQNIVITMGYRGAYYQAHDGSCGHVPAISVDVVDTTAAGDTFVGAYALKVLAAETSVRDAVIVAVKAASLTVQRKGAVDSMPWIDEL